MEASVVQSMKINNETDDRLIFAAEENLDLETYQMLQNLLDSVQIDNMKILKALISAKEDLPLLDGSTKRRVCSLTHYSITIYTN